MNTYMLRNDGIDIQLMLIDEGQNLLSKEGWKLSYNIIAIIFLLGGNEEICRDIVKLVE